MRRALYILADLRDEDLLWFNRAGRVADVRAGETLIETGREVRDLYFILGGEFDVVVASLPVARLAQGDVAGEMSFVENRLPSASVIAASDAQVLAIPRRVMAEHFRQDIGFAARFYHAMAVFLSDRLRTAVSGDAGGSVEELEGDLLDTLHVAGDRFTRLLDLLSGREH
jgi:CRP-like cAMP-binding protein